MLGTLRDGRAVEKRLAADRKGPATLTVTGRYFHLKPAMGTLLIKL